MAQSELNSSSVEQKRDLKEMIRNHGGHEKAFTNLGNKNGLMLSRSMKNGEQLCEADALSAKSKNPVKSYFQ